MPTNRDSSSETVLDNLPNPVTVRQRLGTLLREIELLRRLLPLAERAAQEQKGSAPEEGGR